MLKCSDPFKDRVKCQECKHWIDRSDASIVKTVSSWGIHEYWYCPMHKKSYNSFFSGHPKNIYFGEVQMEEDGTPVGYIRKKNLN